MSQEIRMVTDLEERPICFDFDGVFIKDTPKILGVFPHLFLLYRRLFSFDLFTNLDLENCLIISSRPEEDRKDSENWLKKRNLSPKELILAPKLTLNEEDSALFKALELIKCNALVYVESSYTISKHIKEKLVKNRHDCSIICLEE